MTQLIKVLGLIATLFCWAASAAAQSQRQLDLGGFATGINGDQLMASIASYRAALPAGVESRVSTDIVGDSPRTVSQITLVVWFKRATEEYKFTLGRRVPTDKLGIAKVTSVARWVSFRDGDLSLRDFVSQLEEKFGKDIERYDDGNHSRLYLLFDQRGQRRSIGRNPAQNGPRDRSCRFQEPVMEWRSPRATDWSTESVEDCGISVDCTLTTREPRSPSEAQRADSYGLVVIYTCTIVNELLVRDGRAEAYGAPGSAPGSTPGKL